MSCVTRVPVLSLFRPSATALSLLAMTLPIKAVLFLLVGRVGGSTTTAIAAREFRRHYTRSAKPEL